jgi:hypothetical protein
MEENKQVIDVIYKGFKIEYNEYDECWSSKVSGRAFAKQTLSECKKRIDLFLKKENSFEKIPVFKLDYNYEFNKSLRKGFITSKAEEILDKMENCEIAKTFSKGK